MPWANGLGETIELMRFPSGSSMDEMEFRISVASLNQPGPFSRFSGLERTLMVLDRSEIDLSIDGFRERLSQFDQLTFDGESATELISLTGAARDLNVMSRTEVWTSNVTAFQLEDGPGCAPEEGEVTAWIFVSGNAMDSTGQTLESLDMSISQEMPQWSGTGMAVRIILCRA